MNIDGTTKPVSSAALTTVLDITLDGEAEGFFEIKNLDASSHALTKFEVHMQFSKGGNLIPIATQATDYSTPLWPIRRGDALMTLAALASGKLFMNLQGCKRLVFKAQVATADSPQGVQIAGQVT